MLCMHQNHLWNIFKIQIPELSSKSFRLSTSRLGSINIFLAIEQNDGYQPHAAQVLESSVCLKSGSGCDGEMVM